MATNAASVSRVSQRAITAKASASLSISPSSAAIVPPGQSWMDSSSQANLDEPSA